MLPIFMSGDGFALGWRHDRLGSFRIKGNDPDEWLGPPEKLYEVE